MKQKEIEIASSTEHLNKETFYSLVNKNRVSVNVQDAHPPLDDLTERGWASDAVTSRPIYFLDYCAAGKASEADWKSESSLSGIKVIVLLHKIVIYQLK